MYTTTHTTDEELQRLALSREETDELREVFVRTHHPLPDIDDEWANVRASMDSVENSTAFVSSNSRGKFLRVTLYGLIAAACVALAVVLYYPTRREERKSLRNVAKTEQFKSASSQTMKRNATVAKSSATSNSDVAANVCVCETSRGEERNIVLPDGSHVWLNANSRLSYTSHFDNGIRKVQLDGEAYFEVNHDKHHPFIVETKYLTTTVLGTVFNVRAYTRHDANVVLVSGRIAVSDGVGECYLLPGQRAELGDDGNLSVRPENTYPYTQRKLGYFYFDHKTMHDIMAEIGRWYGKTVVFENADVADLKLHFVAERRKKLSTVVEMLNRIDSINVVIDRNEIVVH